jgi:acetyl-CoA carboxylase carboxyl transferase subunit alpha
LNYESQDMNRMLEKRYQRIMRFGAYIEEPVK